MTTTAYRRQPSWSTRLLLALTLIIAGAGAATWGLARYDRAAQLLGVAPQPAKPVQRTQPLASQLPAGTIIAEEPAPEDEARIAELEGRLARVENATRRAEGSAGRADALVVAFAARRAIDRGAPLGYLEPLLIDRFGPRHPNAVATIVTASRDPVILAALVDEYEAIGPGLRAGGSNDGWWTNIRRELGSLVEVRRADKPAVNPDARYARAMERLKSGEVSAALTETMRLPGAARAGPWATKARRYIAAHRALDEIESAALLAGGIGR